MYHMKLGQSTFMQKYHKKKRRRTQFVSLHSPYRFKIPINREMFINEFEGTYERRCRGDKTKKGHRIRRKNYD